MSTRITATTVLANAAAGLVAFAAASPFAVAGLVALVAASPVKAEYLPTLRLAYHPAELRTDSGANVALQRIRRGARDVCFTKATAHQEFEARRCRKEMIDLMVTRLASPRLAGLHAADGSVRIAAR